MYWLLCCDSIHASMLVWAMPSVVISEQVFRDVLEDLEIISSTGFDALEYIICSQFFIVLISIH